MRKLNVLKKIENLYYNKLKNFYKNNKFLNKNMTKLSMNYNKNYI